MAEKNIEKPKDSIQEDPTQLHTRVDPTKKTNQTIHSLRRRDYSGADDYSDHMSGLHGDDPDYGP